ncbi:MAG: DUF308 domain-containing protein [Streptosporangiaceae bacterium]|jgi:uncharacterized membrane protein HdeD (DUF308 family)
MSEQVEADVTRMVGRHWGWVLGFGVITILAAIAVLAWPAETLLVIAVLFGCQLVIFGVYRFVAAFAYSFLSGGMRALFAILGVLSLIVGLWAIRHAGLTLLALAVLLGIFWIINGTVEIFTAATEGKDLPGRGWTIAMGVLSVVAGIIVLADPGISLLTLAIVLGCWLLVFGIMEIVSAFRLRSAAQPSSAYRPAHV